MATKLIIEGNAVYEIDEDCLENRQKTPRNQKNAVPKNNNGMSYRNKKRVNIQKDKS